jgi:hypothetical protein
VLVTPVIVLPNPGDKAVEVVVVVFGTDEGANGADRRSQDAHAASTRRTPKMLIFWSIEIRPCEDTPTPFQGARKQDNAGLLAGDVPDQLLVCQQLYTIPPRWAISV